VASNPPAGWYPDPEQPGRQRYWDGSAWAQHFNPQTLIDADFKSVELIRAKEKRLPVTSDGLS
jgi:Protein of unknown function (DUF2510)